MINQTTAVKAAKKPLSTISDATRDAINTLESMWQQVEAVREVVRGTVLQKRPDSCFTIDEYCAQFQVGLSTAQHQLRRMMRTGSLRRDRVLLPDAIGRIVIQNVYTPILPVTATPPAGPTADGINNAGKLNGSTVGSAAGQ